MVKNSEKLLDLLHSLCLGWAAGFIGNNAGVNAWCSFDPKLVKQAQKLCIAA